MWHFSWLQFSVSFISSEIICDICLHFTQLNTQVDERTRLSSKLTFSFLRLHSVTRCVRTSRKDKQMSQFDETQKISRDNISSISTIKKTTTTNEREWKRIFLSKFFLSTIHIRPSDVRMCGVAATSIIRYSECRLNDDQYAIHHFSLNRFE